MISSLIFFLEDQNTELFDAFWGETLIAGLREAQIDWRIKVLEGVFNKKPELVNRFTSLNKILAWCTNTSEKAIQNTFPYISKNVEEGYGPLIIFAAGTGNLRVLKTLIRHKACVSYSFKKGQFSAISDPEAPLINSVIVLLTTGNDTKDKGKMIQCLLEAKASLDQGSPLANAVCKESHKEMEMLLRAKASVNKKTKVKKNLTPLELAALKGNQRSCEILLSAKADLDPLNENQAGPLACAAQEGYSEVLELLLSSKASIDTLARGTTPTFEPLCLACQHSHTDCVRILLRYKADVNTQCKSKNHGLMTPLEIAKAIGKSEIIKLLEEHQ